MKITEHEAGHMTKMAAMPLYFKFSEPASGPISMKLGM